jgi:glutathione peroxidase
MDSVKGIHQFTVKTIDGQDFDLAQLEGKKVLVVNVASECGLTPQYEQMEELYSMTSRDKFEIIGVPANNFGGQEPGTNEEIASFCNSNFGTTFPMMAKISVTGNDQHELYQYLTKRSLNGVADIEMVWNFQKILVDVNGQLVKTVHPKTLPIDDEIVNWING